MAIIVEPVQRYQKVGDKTSPQLYYLKRKANNSRLYNTKRIAQEIEELGGMSAEDVEHVVTALVRNIKRKLTDGDSVKLDGLGVFYTTFHSKGTPSSEECTVKNIDKVNIRFLTDSGLRLRSHHQRQPQQRGVQPLQPQRGRSLLWRWQRQR